MKHKNALLSFVVLFSLLFTSCDPSGTNIIKREGYDAHINSYTNEETFYDATEIYLDVTYANQTTERIDKTKLTLSLLDKNSKNYDIHKTLESGNYIVTASYKNADPYKYTIEVKSTKKTLKRISVSRTTEVDYFVNTEIPKSDVKVIATFEMPGEQSLVNEEVYDFEFGEYDNSTEGTKVINVYYTFGNKTSEGSFHATFIDPKLVNIEAMCLHDIGLGDVLANEDFQVFATFNNGLSNQVYNFVIKEYSTSTVGNKLVSIEYTNKDITKSCSAPFVVVDYVLTSIEASYIGDKYVGDSLKNSDFLVIGKYEKREDKEISNFKIGTYDKHLEQQEIIISFMCGEFTFSDTCIVNLKVKELTAIEINATNVELGNGKTKNLAIIFYPSDATYKDITWSSSNESVATVTDEGVVVASSSAKEGSKAMITARSVKYPSIFSSCEIIISNQNVASWTILIYLCGANLESNYSAATIDLKEIVSVSNKPKDIHIAIQTGGAKNWDPYFGINSEYNQRWHVENQQLVKDNDRVYGEYIPMTRTKTLRDFIVWGYETYPADKIGLILWNHGGAMDGVCMDEKDSKDSLTNDEVKEALSSSPAIYQNLEFIGYDACLMAVQDVIEFNSGFAKYLVASEELTETAGWDYSMWLKTLYSKETSINILKRIVTSYISSNAGPSIENYQTLSIIDLSKMDNYKDTFENLASKLGSIMTKDKWTIFKDILIDKTTKFGYDEVYGYWYDIYDVGSFISCLQNDTAFKNDLKQELISLSSALSSLVLYNQYGGKYQSGQVSGMTLFCPVFSKGNVAYYKDSGVYTNFETWRALCYQYLN